MGSLARLLVVALAVRVASRANHADDHSVTPSGSALFEESIRLNSNDPGVNVSEAISQTFATLTTIPARMSHVNEILEGFETHELTPRGRLGLLGFMVIIDGTLTSDDRSRATEARQRFLWATFVLNEDTRTFGQAHSINTGLSHAHFSGAKYW